MDLGQAMRELSDPTRQDDCLRRIQEELREILVKVHDLSGEGEREDVIQTILLGLLRQASRPGETERARAYLRGAVQNGVISAVRARKKQESLPDHDALGGRWTPGKVLPTRVDDPEQIVLDAEEARRREALPDLEGLFGELERFAGEIATAVRPPSARQTFERAVSEILALWGRRTRTLDEVVRANGLDPASERDRNRIHQRHTRARTRLLEALTAREEALQSLDDRLAVDRLRRLVERLLSGEPEP